MTTQSAEPAGAQTPAAYVPPRLARNVMFGVVIGAVIAGWIGAALAPQLIAQHPLAMVALNANNRYLILVTNQLDATSFYTVAVLRRVVPTLAFYLLGRWFGHRAVNWLEGRDPATGEAVRFIERMFDKAGWVVVAVAPMTMTALLAGAAKFRAKFLVPLVIISISIRLVILRQLGEVFSGPVDSVVDWIGHWRVPLLVLSVISVASLVWSQRRSRAASIEELTALDDDLD